jgi:CHASE3 domain sensor protein
MEIGTIIALLSSLLSLIGVWVKHRQQTAPKREDKEIEKTIASGDGKAIGSLIHTELNRMRNEDTKQ